MIHLDAVRRLALPALGLLIAALPVAPVLAGQTYDAVQDFSLSSNPNGTWSYGTLSAATGGSFNVFTLTASNDIYQGRELWGNGESFPDSAVVERNNSGATVQYDTITLPTNLLRLDGQSFIDDVRWTAPTAGVYNVAGYFQRIDSNGGVYVNVGVDLNGTSLFSYDSFYGGSATQQSFNLSALSLKAGDVIDFYEAPAQASYDSTGLSAQIVDVSAVPEPSSLMLCGIAGATLALTTWRARRRMPRLPRNNGAERNDGDVALR
jgi:PEP-CTERM motif